MIETYELAGTDHYRLEWIRSQRTGETGYRILARRDAPGPGHVPDVTVRLDEPGAVPLLSVSGILRYDMDLAEYRTLMDRGVRIADELERLRRVIEIDLRRQSV